MVAKAWMMYKEEYDSALLRMIIRDRYVVLFY